MVVNLCKYNYFFISLISSNWHSLQFWNVSQSYFAGFVIRRQALVTKNLLCLTYIYTKIALSSCITDWLQVWYPLSTIEKEIQLLLNSLQQKAKLPVFSNWIKRKTQCRSCVINWILPILCNVYMYRISSNTK